MARKRTSVKNSTINCAAPASPELLERYCRGLDGWPRAWMGMERDGAPGLGCFALRTTTEEQRPDGTFRLASGKQALRVTLNR
jgi:hypothetical protein